MSVLATETVSTTGGREGRSTSADGKINLAQSPPGSNGPGTNPEQLFAAGYSACFGGAIGAAAGQVMEELAATLPKTKEPTDLIVLLDAFAAAGKTAAPHATPVLALLEHKEEAVAERAAQALARVHAYVHTSALAPARSLARVRARTHAGEAA